MHPPSLAVAFEHPGGAAVVAAKLRQAAGWEWHARENDRLGDYFWASLPEAGGVARLFDDGGAQVLDLEFKSGDAAAQHAWRALLQKVRERLLPDLGATAIRVLPGYGR